MPATSQPSFLFSILTDSRYRWGRHVLLILGVAVISFNMFFFTYRENIPLLANRAYYVAFLLLSINLIVFYTNIYILLPRFLLKKKYRKYILLLSSTVILLLLLQLLSEYFTCLITGIPHLRSSYFNAVTLLDCTSSFWMTMICILGGSMPVLLKHWTIEHQRVTELENRHIQTEVEQLKEQVDPVLLFNILNRTGVLAGSEPLKASGMLMKLSQLLRYQLYDCNRKWVLLDAEIKFLTTYLTLEQQYSGRFEFVVLSAGNMIGVFVPPLLFIPFVRLAVQQLYNRAENGSILLRFEVNDTGMNFICDNYVGDASFYTNEFTPIRERLEFFYKNRYNLSVTGNVMKLQLLFTETCVK